MPGGCFPLLRHRQCLFVNGHCKSTSQIDEMSRKVLFLIIIIVVMSGCVTRRNVVFNQPASQIYTTTLDTLKLFDQSRNREIPLALFKPKLHASNNFQQVVIFSHGYGQNTAGSYLAYSYLTNFLASKGFFVASIQHELPTV